MIKLTLNDLLAYLNAKKLDPTFQPQYGQIFINLTIDEHEIPVFFGIRSEMLLQTIAYLPYEIQPKTLGEIARLLHVLNKELDLPGFGMDEKERLMFFRTVIPTIDAQVEEKMIDMCIGITRLACETFMKAIALVLSGAMTVDSINEKQPES